MDEKSMLITREEDVKYVKENYKFKSTETLQNGESVIFIFDSREEMIKCSDALSQARMNNLIPKIRSKNRYSILAMQKTVDDIGQRAISNIMIMVDNEDLEIIKNNNCKFIQLDIATLENYNTIEFKTEEDYNNTIDFLISTSIIK